MRVSWHFVIDVVVIVRVGKVGLGTARVLRLCGFFGVKVSEHAFWFWFRFCFFSGLGGGGKRT